MTSTEGMGVIGAGLVGAAVGGPGGWLVVAFCAVGAVGASLIVMALGRIGP